MRTCAACGREFRPLGDVPEGLAVGGCPLSDAHTFADKGLQPAGVVTAMRPVAAPTGTTVTILAAVSDTILAGVPSNAARVAPDMLRPVVVTLVPAAPE